MYSVEIIYAKMSKLLQFMLRVYSIKYTV